MEDRNKFLNKVLERTKSGEYKWYKDTPFISLCSWSPISRGTTFICKTSLYNINFIEWYDSPPGQGRMSLELKLYDKKENHILTTCENWENKEKIHELRELIWDSFRNSSEFKSECKAQEKEQIQKRKILQEFGI